MITEALIANFFEGKCDAREASLVQAWLKENPAKLREYIGAEEWENFQPAHVLSPDVSGKLWSNINKHTAPASVHYPYFRWIAAASIILVAGLSWQFIFKKEKTGTTSPLAVAKTKNIFNNAAQKSALTLSDGSTVDLSPNSRLSYPEDFTSTKRDVVLNGEASFNISPDAGRPFSVYSHSLLITVLGTRFTVSADEGDNGTKVILHEGSIMVKIADSSSQDDNHEYRLTPGDVLIYKKVNKRSARILHLEKDKDDCYVFDNYPLDVVFDQLQIIYNTKIVYDKAGLGNRSFIGKVDKKDSVYHILQSIALLNNFHLQKQGDSFIIGN